MSELIPQEIVRASVPQLKKMLASVYQDFMGTANGMYALWIHLVGDFTNAELIYLELERRQATDIKSRFMIVKIRNRMRSLPGIPPRNWVVSGQV